MWKTCELPGNTLPYVEKHSSPAFVKSLDSANNSNILLITSKIGLHNLFNNGLFQNVIIIYRMLENMGYNPTLLVNEKQEASDFPAEWSDIRSLTIEEFIRNPFKLIASIEIGMSLEKGIRSYFKQLGAKNIKLYLGNVLNIDIETSLFYKNAELAHHLIGETDELWVSPHYAHHLDYTCAMNNVKTGVLAPYVWDPMILKVNAANLKWRQVGVGETQHILVFEPNISFQKCCILPLAICEKYYTKNLGANIKLHIYNSDRFNDAPYFKESLLKNTRLAQDGRVELHGRESVVKLLESYPSAVIICHQTSNEFNYMVLECLYSGFPVLHNATAWREAGYFYEGNRVNDGCSALTKAITNHSRTLPTYLSDAKALLWKHSIDNPDIKREWEELLLRKAKDN
jgi:hypothetical protein